MFVQVDFIQRGQRFVDFHDFVTEVVRIEDSRRFHSRECHKLDKMILHHITQGACRFVEAAALFDAEILDCRDFYVVDIIPVPKGFEDTVGKAESEYVLGSLLTEEMIDTVNLLFVENRSIDFIQFACRFEVVTERLLYDDT